MKRWSTGWALWLTVLVAVGCDSEASQINDDGEVTPRAVETLVLSTTEFVDTFEVLGTAEPRQTVQVSSEVPGRILNAYVDEGTSVERGQALFRIDTEADEAGQEVLKTQVEAAERELERLEQLREEGLATGRQVDNARTELESARQNLRQSTVTVGKNTVRSPADGAVATRLHDPGEFANAGGPLAEIIDYTTIVVYAQVPEGQIRHVDNDETVLDVDVPALDDTFEGRVDRVALRPTDTSRTYTVEIHVDNDELRIRPGMRTRIHFERQIYEDAVVIPRDSILEGYDRREAMVVPGDESKGHAEIRPIETGPGTRDQVVVTDGLEAGDRLIRRGHRGLLGDAYVEVVEETNQHPDDEERR